VDERTVMGVSHGLRASLLVRVALLAALGAHAEKLTATRAFKG
jgi:hypothetical protein